MGKAFRFGPRPRDVTRDVDQEIEAHLVLRAREFEEQGLSPEAARRAALDAFGDREVIAAEVRALRGDTVRARRRQQWLDELRQDLGSAVRGLARNPLFTIVALLTLGLGIGANSAAFSVLHSVILRPLPYPQAEELVQVWTDHTARGRAEPEWLAPPQYFAIRDQVPAFRQVAAYQTWAPILTGDGEPEALAGGAVAAAFLEVLGTSPARGRGFEAADDLDTAEPVVILSDALWQRRFSGDPDVIGRRIQLSGVSWTVVGILGPDDRLPLAWDLLRPMRRPAASTCNHGCITLRAIARLAPGASMDQAHQQVAAVLGRLVAESPEENDRIGPWLVPLHEQVTGPVRPALMALFGAVGFVLLIACVNLASLTMVRAAARAREFGVRAALGAGRGRIIRQLLTESLLVAFLGGVLGIWLGTLGTRLLTVLVPPAIQGVQSISLDGTVVLFTVALTMVVGVVSGLLPALHGARTDLMGVLRNAHPEGGQRVGRVRRGLVVGEVAVALMLLIGAGLLLRTVLNLRDTDLGFQGEGLVIARLSYTPARYPEIASVVASSDALLERARAHPAIAAVEINTQPPLTPGGDGDVSVLADGRPPAPGAEARTLWERAISPGALRTLGARLVAGREFDTEDRAGGALVAIITESAARRFWPDQDPVGRFFTTSPSPSAARYTIVGVVNDLRHDGPGEPVKDQVFIPYAQSPRRVLTLLLEPAGTEAAAISALRALVREADAEMPVSAISSFRERVNDATALPRHFATIVGGFAAAAVLLALIGVYGMMAYAVNQRRTEIGVRLALGADPSRLANWLVREGAKVIMMGVVLGLIGAMGATRALRASLHGVSPFDAVTIGAMTAVVTLTALLACWIPAQRARRVDPVTALRAD